MLKSIYSIIVIICFVSLNNEQKFDAEQSLKSGISNQIYLDDVEEDLDPPVTSLHSTVLKSQIVYFFSVIQKNTLLSFRLSYNPLSPRAPPYFSA